MIGLSETVKITDRLATWKDKKSLLQIVYFEELIHTINIEPKADEFLKQYYNCTYTPIYP